MSKYNRDAHAWLRWIDYEGPFLSEEVLDRVFPNGLAPVEADDRAPLREAWSDWRHIVLHRASEHSDEDRRAVHQAWIRFVLTRALELEPEDGLVEGSLLPESAHAVIAEHRARVSAELALLQKKGRANDHLPRLLVLIVPAGCTLDRPNEKIFRDGWIESAEGRALALLRATGARLALVTNGEQWTLVHAKTNTPSSFVRWTAEQWFDEWTTLDAFRTLLSSYRFFGVPDEQQLERLFEESAKNQQGVTEQLGRQVRRAVEELVAAVDFADRTTGRNLVHAQGERAVYEAAVSVMMRLVFLLAAEERGLLLATDPRYDRAYAVQTLREQLESAATEHGEEVLEHRYAAWSRLLATFRAVHAGVAHHDLRLPAFGGTLFDPDRFPFLEGRPPSSSWRDPAHASAEPIAINDRTVLHLLDALQTLEVRTPNGRERRKLSFGALDVEQIGHVYEGLLDHTVLRAKGVVVSLEGKEGDEPEVALADIEAHAKEGRPALCKWLAELTGRTVKSLAKSLDEEPAPEDLAKLERACGEDPKLVARVRPWLALVRRNLADLPVVFDAGTFYVTAGVERRATGTHYTPRTLTEDIVRHALEPLVYVGPSEGLAPERWTLRSPAEILALRVCDPAMGSGAFLVQACRYLSARLVEAWLLEAERTGTILRVSPSGAAATGDPREQLLPETEEERLLLARRFVVERCLYGVDKNPMAVEMARLSLWLVTLQKDRSFTFLDHALKVGDSLLGVTSQKQLVWFHPNPKTSDRLPDPVLQRVGPIQMALGMARELRETIEDTSTQSVGDLRNKSDLLRRSDTRAQGLRVAGDELVRVLLDNAGAKEKALQKALEAALDRANADVLAAQSGKWIDRPKLTSDKGDRLPFHWAIEFPEVFGRENPGFDAIIANPPFRGGKLITGMFGTDYRDYLLQWIADGRKGHADLVAYFFLRANALVRSNGIFALIATNTIAQGDTREVGLDAIVASGATIMSALPSMPWPGDANLEVSVIWCFRGGWRGATRLRAC